MKVGILGFSVDPSSSPTFGVLWLEHVDMEEVVMYTEKIAFTYSCVPATQEEPEDLVRPIS